MDFRRGGSDERRRRVLIDEVAAKDKDRDEEPSETKPARRPTVRLYSDGAASTRQPRITDLLPINWLPLTLVAAFLVLAPACLTLVGHQLHAKDWLRDSPALAGFDLRQRGNIAEWFASLLLAGAALLCLVIFSIRRHRTDDYQGQYRIWILFAAALVWGSLDASTHLRDAMGLLVTRVTGQVLLGRPAGWWLLGYFLAGGGLAIRMGLEMRRSYAAIAFLGLTAILYVALGAVGTILHFQDSLTEIVTSTALTFAATISLVLTLISYARFIYREAEGLIAAAKRRKAKLAEERKRAKASEAEAAKTESKPAPASEKASPLAGKVSAAKASSAKEADEEDEDEDEDSPGLLGSKLSKSERKRLKRMQSAPQPTRRAA